ncbi:MAG: plasmid maintenance system killer [Acidobacteriia bacterium]|nr:plasmid maintenance system killer [Terriglobia bacterium]MYC67758.1 plasmid maintenance system killer [Terriglobia bacterium]
MKIRNVVHRGRGFIQDDSSARMQPTIAPTLRRIVSFLEDMEREEELRSLPSWRAHRLTGDRRDTWSWSVTANWRLTFRIDREETEIFDLNYEDYH